MYVYTYTYIKMYEIIVLKSCLVCCNDFNRMTGKWFQISIQENILSFAELSVHA